MVIKAADAAIAARWLRGTGIPAMRRMPGTVLGGGYSEDVSRLERLAGTLSRKADRKRQVPEFSALVGVDDAAAFVRAVDRCCPLWPLRHNLAIIRLAAAMTDGGQIKQRGRKRLGKDQIVRRISGVMAIDERHRLRLAARAKKDAVHQAWWAEVRARGETILTTDLPFPKI